MKINGLFWAAITAALVLATASRSQAGGTVVAWGQNGFTQTNVQTSSANIQAIAAGSDNLTPSGGFSLALKPDGTIAAWGYNAYMQTSIPTGATNIVSLAAGEYHGVALRADGKVYAWGRNNAQQTNVPPGLSSNVVAIAAGSSGGDHSLALRSDGTVVGWGLNTSTQTNVPANATNVVDIAAGMAFSMALRADGTVVAWGTSLSLVTNVPAGATNVVAIAAGTSHALALRTNGTVIAWGNNANSQTVVPVAASNVVAIAAGDEHSMALRRDGTMVVWGNTNAYFFDWPVAISNVTAIASGGRHALALTGDGTPGITVPPRNKAIYPGSTAIFQVMAAGPGTLAYQWQFNGVNIPGATGPILVLTNVAPASSGFYQVTVRNSYGLATAGAGLTLLDGRISFQQEPALTNSVGVSSNLTMSVVAAGATPMTFNWWKDGAPIGNATNSSYTITNAQLVNAGGYSVIVSNAYGSLGSSTDMVGVVYYPPVLTQSPIGSNVALSNSYSLTAAANGTAPLMWQWYLNQAPILGATNSTYIINPAQFTDAGSYQVIVTNLAGSATSSVVKITVGFVEGPITNPANNHVYYIVNPGSWTTAQAEAQALGGNLTTIRSSDENGWLVSHLLVNYAGSGGPNLSATPIWIGIYDPVNGDGSGAQHVADFTWIGGETSSYRNWNTATGEPNNNGGFEYYGTINWQWAAGNSGSQGTWNDAGINGTAFSGSTSGNGMGPYYGIAEILPPMIGISLVGTNLSITTPSLTNTMVLQSATNLASPIQWIPMMTNSFHTNFTVPVLPSVGNLFFRVQIQ